MAKSRRIRESKNKRFIEYDGQEYLVKVHAKYDNLVDRTVLAYLGVVQTTLDHTELNIPPQEEAKFDRFDYKLARMWFENTVEEIESGVYARYLR